jgi:hypothetical protein
MAKAKPSKSATPLPMPAEGGTYIRRADGTLERLDNTPAPPTETDTPAAPAKED